MPTGMANPDLRSGTTLGRAEIAEEWAEWPHFHNSVATALRGVDF